MKRLSTLALALALAAPVIGCRATHLGPNTGHAYRDALSSQRESEAAPVAPLDADDSRAVLKAHRAGGADAKGRSTGRGTSTSSSSSATSAPTDIGGGSGNFGPSGRQIRLDAK